MGDVGVVHVIGYCLQRPRRLGAIAMSLAALWTLWLPVEPHYVPVEV